MAVKTFEVKAKENCSSGGAALNTGINVAKGDKLTISAKDDDTWSCGAGDRDSNANGLIAGNQYGGVYGNYTDPAGAVFPLGSLVGSLDDGKTFFLVGTKFDAAAPQSGTLSLWFWDVSAGDNAGSITASVDVAPIVKCDVKAKENSVSGGTGLNTGITLAKGDRLVISVAEDDTWSATASDISNANGFGPGTTAYAKYGNYVRAGSSFPYGSLVGSLDGGKTFFLVGTRLDKAVTEAGPLSLYYWDSDSVNNLGFVTATISVSKAAA